jgi:Fis family transcriptional regulator, factor for inversion stimulation protein
MNSFMVVDAPKPAPVEEDKPVALRDSVEKAMNNYFSQLQDEDAVDVYELVMAEVEAPLLEATMKYVRSNQTRAAKVLGLNRGTLRKKLKTYGML